MTVFFHLFALQRCYIDGNTSQLNQLIGSEPGGGGKGGEGGGGGGSVALSVC